MLTKIKNFFLRIKPSKRKVIQLYAALLHNANIKGFITGNIYTGDSKVACAPGLNCYSCPGAVGACPLGSLQNSLSESKTKLPTYILGIILLYSIILGRTICGFLCPFGLIQELLYKIKTPKLQKNKVTRVLSYFKYVLLVALVVILPLIYGLQSKNLPLPAFCKYICPAGTLEGAVFLLVNPNNIDFFGMLGQLFTWKFIVLIVIIVGSIFMFRFFCRFLCPLGALYGLFNKLSILGVKVDKSKCNGCQACVNHCKMDVKEVGDHECIQCGECRNVCHCNAISWKTLNKIVKDSIEEEQNNQQVVKKDVKEELNNEQIEKKDRRIDKKIFNRICLIVASIILIAVLILVNFQNKTLNVGDICYDLTITMIDSTTFDIKQDENSTLLYFYNEINDEDFENIRNYANEKLNIILVTNSSNENLESEFADLNIGISYDTDILSKFSEKEVYPYSIFLDFSDKILIKSNAMITGKEYSSIILPVLSGKTIGSSVGDICIDKEINLIGSDETFQVSDYLGKIVIINFWFTGCTPCVQELPHFNSLYEKYKEDVVVIAIHEANQYLTNDVIGFINNQFAGFSILFGYDDVENPYYNILFNSEVWPSTVIVDKDGIVKANVAGSMSESDLESAIVSLLNQE